MTTSTNSTRLEVKQALKDALETHDTISTGLGDGAVTITIGTPSRDPERLQVWIGGATSAEPEEQKLAAGRRQRIDHFTIDVHIDAYQPGLSGEDAEVLAEQLYGALEDVIADDSGLDGTAWSLIQHRDGPVSMAHPDGEGYMAGEFVRVDCKSRLV